MCGYKYISIFSICSQNWPELVCMKSELGYIGQFWLYANRIVFKNPPVNATIILFRVLSVLEKHTFSLCPRSSKSSERAYWFHLVLRCRCLFVCPFTFFSPNHFHYCFNLLIGKWIKTLSENFGIFWPLLRFLGQKTEKLLKISKSN